MLRLKILSKAANVYRTQQLNFVQGSHCCSKLLLHDYERHRPRNLMYQLTAR